MTEWKQGSRYSNTPNSLHTVTTNPAGRVHRQAARRQWLTPQSQAKCCAVKHSHSSTSVSFPLLLIHYVVLFIVEGPVFWMGFSDISLPLIFQSPPCKGCCRRTGRGGVVSKPEVILPTGGCVCLDCVSTQGTPMQSNKPVPGGSTSGW